MVCIIKSLVEVNDKWKSTFNNDLLENVFQKYESIKDFISDWILCCELNIYVLSCKKESREQIDIYESFKIKVNNFDKELLEKEYALFRSFYMYSQDVEYSFAPTLNDIIKFIESYFDEDEEITLELLKDTLDEYIFHYGKES